MWVGNEVVVGVGWGVRGRERPKRETQNTLFGVSRCYFQYFQDIPQWALQSGASAVSGYY